jgi:hypothetical protein
MNRELFQWYLDHQAELVKKYNGKHLIIKDYSVMDAFDKEEDAYYAAIEKYGLGSFIIQKCTPGSEAYTQRFFSPGVVFL